MPVYVERIYDPPQHEGYRVLADRIWPRGMTKEKAKIDEWCKEIAPSAALRKWYGHDPRKWVEFSKKYEEELAAAGDKPHTLLKRAGTKPIILLTATKDTAHAHTAVLKKFLESL